MDRSPVEFLLARKRQAVTVSIGPRRWALTHFEADPEVYTLPMGWKRLFDLSGDFVTIARKVGI